MLAQADGGKSKIITRFSATNLNLDKPFKSMPYQVVPVPWPKLFQNLLATCETEWLNDGYLRSLTEVPFLPWTK